MSESNDEWSEDRLESDPRFLQRVEAARKNLRAGRGVRLEDIESERRPTPMAEGTENEQ
jgi:hypothetical protein